MRFICLCILICLPFLVSAQKHTCLATEGISSAADSLRYTKFQSRLKYKLDQQISSRSVSYLPVVVHIVAKPNATPVSLAQVLHQMDVLNADFAGQGENIEKLLPEFVPIAGASHMRFCLAQMDPDGHPTSGITYTETDIDNIALQTGPEGRVAIHYDELGGKTGWDPSRYINIWVGEYGDILGSASFPGSAPFPEEAGLVIGESYFGSVGGAGRSGFYRGGHTVTHEMGHFFGLKHTWGNGFDYTCDDSDDIEDTPNSEGPYFGCPAGVQASCGSNDMYQNFMELTDDRCLAAFTRDQVTYMATVREVYYPDIVQDGGCAEVTDAFDEWTSALKWSYDVSSNRYIIYSDEEFGSTAIIRVFSVDGRLAYQGTWVSGQSFLLDLNHLASGVCVVQITEGEKYFVRKIVLY